MIKSCPTIGMVDDEPSVCKALSRLITSAGFNALTYGSAQAFLDDNPTSPIKSKDVKADFIIVTHAHGDHIGDSIAIAKANNATVIANFEIANWCGEQGVTAHPLHIGGAHDFPFGKVKLTVMH